MVPKDMNRRQFLKVSAATAAVAGGGIEGILAARQAPAYAQGTKLHWVRWVDFIPESDVELKRQMPEASKALGAEVTLETINANDLQPRITAAVQSGSGADIFNFQYNWPHLYQNAVVDVSDVAGALAKAEGGFYDVWAPSCQVNGKWLSVPHSIVGNAVAYRKSWLKEAGASAFPKTWDETRKLFAALKKKGKPYGQTLGHTFGDAPTFTYPMTWAFGGAETDASGKKVVLNSKGAVDAVKFMQAFWKECCDEGGLAWDDTNNNRAFHAGELSATLNGASIYIVAKRQKEKIKDDKGEPIWQDIDHAPLPAGAGRPLPAVPEPVARGDEVRQEPEARQGLAAVAPQAGELRQVVRHPGGLLASARPRSGRTSRCGASWTSHSRCSARPPATPGCSAMRARPPRKRRRPSRSTSSPTCTPRASRA